MLEATCEPSISAIEQDVSHQYFNMLLGKPNICPCILIRPANYGAIGLERRKVQALNRQLEEETDYRSCGVLKQKEEDTYENCTERKVWKESISFWEGVVNLLFIKME